MQKEFSTGIELRFADLDLYNHVNSVVYFSFLETARVRLFRDAFQELTGRGIFSSWGRRNATTGSRSSSTTRLW